MLPVYLHARLIAPLTMPMTKALFDGVSRVDCLSCLFSLALQFLILMVFDLNDEYLMSKVCKNEQSAHRKMVSSTNSFCRSDSRINLATCSGVLPIRGVLPQRSSWSPAISSRDWSWKICILPIMKIILVIRPFNQRQLGAAGHRRHVDASRARAHQAQRQLVGGVLFFLHCYLK